MTDSTAASEQGESGACRCPFYGLGIIAGYPVEQPGNRCALILSAHSPCHMEVREEKAPDWDECPRNIKEGSGSVVPREIMELGQVVRHGHAPPPETMRMRYRRIMGREYLSN